MQDYGVRSAQTTKSVLHDSAIKSHGVKDRPFPAAFCCLPARLTAFYGLQIMQSTEEARLLRARLAPDAAWPADHKVVDRLQDCAHSVVGHAGSAVGQDHPIEGTFTFTAGGPNQAAAPTPAAAPTNNGLPMQLIVMGVVAAVLVLGLVVAGILIRRRLRTPEGED